MVGMGVLVPNPAHTFLEFFDFRLIPLKTIGYKHTRFLLSQVAFIAEIKIDIAFFKVVLIGVK